MLIPMLYYTGDTFKKFRGAFVKHNKYIVLLHFLLKETVDFHLT